MVLSESEESDTVLVRWDLEFLQAVGDLLDLMQVVEPEKRPHWHNMTLPYVDLLEFECIFYANNDAGSSSESCHKRTLTVPQW